MKFLAPFILVFLMFCGTQHAEPQPQAEQPIKSHSAPVQAAKHGSMFQNEMKLADSIWYIAGFMLSMMFVFGAKKLAESFVESRVTLWMLKKQGKAAEGLHVRYEGYTGTIVEAAGGRIKIEIDNKSKGCHHNFLLVNPKSYHEGHVEILMDKD